MERICKKWNVYVLQKFQSMLGCALTVILKHPEYENFIGVVSMLRGTYFGKVDFINTFLMDFCLLLYISEYSGKTMEQNGHGDGKKLAQSLTTTTILIVRPKYILKLVSAISYQIFSFSSNDRPSKTMKNVFYFI